MRGFQHIQHYNQQYLKIWIATSDNIAEMGTGQAFFLSRYPEPFKKVPSRMGQYNGILVLLLGLI